MPAFSATFDSPMLRELQPELLDTLAPDHPDARRNRRDLRITNHLLGNYRWFARLLPALLRPGERVLELGAGTGELGARLARAGLALDGLDRWPRPAAWPPARLWHQADLRAFPGYAPYAAVCGNLIFHQLTAPELAALGARLRATARLIVASEPVRRRRSQVLFATLGRLLGANHVSLHDAHVSIAAGFRADELPRLLGLAAPAWECTCTTTWLGATRLVARRLA